MWPFQPVQKPTLWCLNQVQTKHTRADLLWHKINLPLILMFPFFLLLRRTIKETRLHVVNVSDRIEENNLEPEWAGSVNINFVPAADSSGLARPDQRKKKKNYPKLLSSIARSSPSEIQEWRKSFWIASSRRIDVAQLSFFFDRIKIPRWTWGVRYPPSALWLFACFPLSLPC